MDKLMVGIPAMDTVMTEFCQSLVGLAVSEGTAFNFTRGSLVYDGRNQITMGAIEGGYDVILWTDTDMFFPPDVYMRLKKTMDKTGADVVSGLYVTRKTPIEPVIYSRLGTEQQGDMIAITREVYKDYPKDSVFDIEGCGFGLCLTKVEAFRKVWERFGQPFAPLPAMGEDLSACYRIRQAGGKIVCDSRVKAEHIGLFHVGEDDL